MDTEPSTRCLVPGCNKRLEAGTEAKHLARDHTVEEQREARNLRIAGEALAKARAPKAADKASGASSVASIDSKRAASKVAANKAKVEAIDEVEEEVEAKVVNLRAAVPVIGTIDPSKVKTREQVKAEKAARKAAKAERKPRAKIERPKTTADVEALAAELVELSKAALAGDRDKATEGRIKSRRLVEFFKGIVHTGEPK